MINVWSLTILSAKGLMIISEIVPVSTSMLCCGFLIVRGQIDTSSEMLLPVLICCGIC